MKDGSSVVCTKCGALVASSRAEALLQILLGRRSRLASARLISPFGVQASRTTRTTRPAAFKKHFAKSPGRISRHAQAGDPVLRCEAVRADPDSMQLD